MSTVKGKLKPLKDKVIVHNMEFGEQRTRFGLVIPGDDGKVTGVHPRWGQVFAKGPDNDDPYNVGDWVLVEHGRWTRGIDYQEDDKNEPIKIRMVETKSIMMWSETKPSDAQMGAAIDLPTPVEEYRI
jgi:co-chaperonin GroES (HSP10)